MGGRSHSRGSVMPTGVLCPKGQEGHSTLTAEELKPYLVLETKPTTTRNPQAPTLLERQPLQVQSAAG